MKNALIGHTRRESMWERLNEFPPPLVRCLAREKLRGRAVRALTDQEVALASGGLTTGDVRDISKSRNWDEITIKKARLFCKGCMFDPLSAADRNRAGAYMRTNPRFTFLRNHPHWESTFLPLVKLYQDA